MEKLEQLYEGKAKKVFKTADPDVLIVSYKDDATAFNGEKKGTIVGKGAINNRMTNHLFKLLEKKGIYVRVVSMPAQNIFDEQNTVYKEEVLPPSVTKRLAIEAGSSFGWGKYIGLRGKTLTIDTWGASAPGERIFKEYGFTAENAAALFEQI